MAENPLFAVFERESKAAMLAGREQSRSEALTYGHEGDKGNARGVICW
jgi:hypothetical protein